MRIAFAITATHIKSIAAHRFQRGVTFAIMASTTRKVAGDQIGFATRRLGLKCLFRDEIVGDD